MRRDYLRTARRRDALRGTIPPRPDDVEPERPAGLMRVMILAAVCIAAIIVAYW